MPSGATVTYQWQSSTTSNGTYSNITSATSNIYTPVAGDGGKFLRVVATGSNTYGGSVTSAATTAAVISYAPNGNYYLSNDGTLRAGTNVAVSGATYGTFDTKEDDVDVSATYGGNPASAKLLNNTGIHLYGSYNGNYDHNFLLQNGQTFNSASNVTIHVAPLVQTSSGNDGDVGHYYIYGVPLGVSGSYVVVSP